MSELFASGRIIDLILVLILVEGLVLALVHRHTGRGLPPSDLIGFLLSGFLLMLALRAALVGLDQSGPDRGARHPSGRSGLALAAGGAASAWLSSGRLRHANVTGRLV